jgi:hypothetical protein
MKSGQSECMFCISQGSQCRQDRRYIAAIQTAAMRAGNDDITSFFGFYFFQLCWGKSAIQTTFLNCRTMGDYI